MIERPALEPEENRLLRPRDALRTGGAERGARAAPAATDGRLIYAIGDVHGRCDLLRALLRKLWVDAAGSQPDRPPVVILLGDYVDRGPASSQVLEVLIQMRAASDVEARCLMGNHEEALLRFLDDAAFGPTWHDYGGAATLASYEVAAPPRDAPLAAWEAARLEFTARAPSAHIQLLRSLELTCVIGDFAFVHAGVRPGVSLARQQAHDLLWIREPFLQSRSRFEKVIVHGHTPAEEAFDGAYRIGVDTGAYATSVLTSVRLFGPSRSFLQVRSSDLGEDGL